MSIQEQLATASERVRRFGKDYCIREVIKQVRLESHLGTKLQLLREAIGESQPEFADNISLKSNFRVSVWTLRAIEQRRGAQYLDPRWSTIQVICNYLGIAADDLRNLSEIK